MKISYIPIIAVIMLNQQSDGESCMKMSREDHVKSQAAAVAFFFYFFMSDRPKSVRKFL